jgi:hypothetical protein
VQASSERDNAKLIALELVMLYQEIHKYPNPRWHCGATDKHCTNWLHIAGVPSFQQWHQVAALNVLRDGKLTNARDSSA